eukprot:s1939_g2.t1
MFSLPQSIHLLYSICPLKANRKMALELQQIKDKSKSFDKFKTPPPKVSAPSPTKGSPTPVSSTAQGSKGDPKAKKAIVPPADPKAKKAIVPPADRPPPATEGAKLNRLRRLCETKPSGKCQVPTAIHQKWKHGSKEDKEALIEELERVNWRDRYNKKLWRYYVVYREEDEDLSEDEERRQHETQEALCHLVEFSRLGVTNDDSNSEDDDDDERRPTQRSVQGLEQAIETLDAQFHACELVKIDVGGLSNKNLSETDQKLFLFGLGPMALVGVVSKACCKHVVQIAKNEVESNPRASEAMWDFASIREADAEVGVRRVLVKHGYTAPIELSWIDLDEDKELKKFPWIKLSSWAKHLLDIHALPRQMVGVPTFQKMRGVLAEFWERYRGMDPEHPVFSLERAGVVSCDRLVPYYSHSDEGRTFRDSALWVFNTHGVIGRGTLAFLKKNKHRAPVRRNAQGLNYVGNTWSTHCLIATMMKDVATPEALSTLLSAFASDARSLLHEGLGNGDEKVWFCHLADKGDLPALAKIGRFTRTFGHAPKAASSKKPGRGVCWTFLAGQEQDDKNNRVALPYEDVTTQPIWEDTIGTSLPWETAPTILEGLDLDDQRAIDFFETDFFHNVHLGVAGTKAINIAVTYLYENGLWLRGSNARQVSLWLFSFLGHVAVCAHLT